MQNILITILAALLLPVGARASHPADKEGNSPDRRAFGLLGQVAEVNTETYEADNPWPATQTIEGMDEGSVYRETTRYRYTRFDEQGNWTEREVRSQCLEGEEDEEEGKLLNVKEREELKRQTRTIRYY